MQQLEEWLIGFTGEAYLLIAEIFLIVLAAMVMGFLAGRLFDFLQKHAAMTANFWDDAVVDACRRPVVWAIWILGVNSAAAIAARQADSEWYALLAPTNRVVIIFLAAMFLLNLIKRVERNLVHPDYTSDPMDETTVKAVGKLLRASVIITATLIAMQAFGYSISGLLAFGGIGGLAVGFAAKDLLANFFGGLMIYLDQPFKVGDWVRSPDKEIEGTVEDIGWRLTRIRTFDKRPLYVPNSVFNSIALENPSRMFNRRIYETVGIRYQDIDEMAGIVADVKQMLCDHPEIDQEQTMIVNFVSFGASSINFFVYTFTKTTKWVTFHEVKQDVLLKISDIVASHGAEIAFPTSTVHIPNQLRLLQAAEAE